VLTLPISRQIVVRPEILRNLAVLWVDIAVSVVGLLVGIAGTAWAVIYTTEIRTHMKNVRLAIETGDGRLVEMIDIEAIDKEDPEKLERALQEVKRVKHEAEAAA
jgi:hypothetical protein